jgi:hypothetical protein
MSHMQRGEEKDEQEGPRSENRLPLESRMMLGYWID